jgi:eukaryotic-like serine/threonine-protein kinase
VDSTLLRLADRYRLDEESSRGPVTTVWRGWDESKSRQVAVKMVRAARLDDALFCARFLEAAGVAARLSHPAIVAVYDVGEAPDGTGRSVPYLVMEFLHGQDLAKRLAKGPLPWREAIAVLTRVASAVAHAHAQGIAHEGLKPSNVFLASGGAKVLDFGSARALGGPAKDAVSADVNALGLLLRETLSGKPGGRLPADVPPPVAEICARCLSPDPRVRPTAAEVAAKLTALRDEVQVAGDVIAGPGASMVGSEPNPGAAEPGATRRRVAVPGHIKGALAAVGALTLMLVLALALNSGSSGSAGPPQAADATVTPTTEPTSPDAPRTSPPSSPTAEAAANPEPTRTATPSASSSPIPEEPPAPTASPTRGVRPPVGSNPVQVLEAAERSVREGISRGEIRFDVGTDLNNSLGGLKRDLQSGVRVDLAGRVGLIRDKISTRVRERGLSRGRADQLDGILAQIRT